MDHEPFFLPGKMPEKINEYLKSSGQETTDDKGQMIRILLESLAAKYNDVIKIIEGVTGNTIDVLHIVGGGCQNDLLNQLTANATGKKIVTGPIEATVLGNVLVQALATGQVKSLQEGRGMLAGSFELKEFLPA
jgi:sugar (pentulose or hexulose) kinase